MRYWLCFLLLVNWATAQNDPTANIDLDVMLRSPHWDGTIATSHNGGILFGPQDTMVVFAKSCEVGADIIEVDIRVTADGHLIAFHDAEFHFLNSTGTGLIRERTLEYVRSIKARSPIPGIEPQPIPTFREVLKFLKTKNVCLNVEPKDNVIEKIVEDARAEGMLNNILIQAKSPDKAAVIRRLDSTVGMIARYHEESDIDLYAPYHPEVMEVNPEVSDEIVARIKSLGIKVQMKMGYLKDFDFDENSWKKRMQRGVNVALTDFVPQMVSFLRRNAFNIGSEAKLRQSDISISRCTYINTALPAQQSGNLLYSRVFMKTPGIGKVKLFRVVEEKYLLIAESELTNFRCGINIVGMNAAVQQGDLLGVYLESGELENDRSSEADNCVWLPGDIGSGTKSDWQQDSCQFSVDGMIR